MKLFEVPIYYRTRDAANLERYWRDYDYNEVVGWVVLFPRRNAIRAEYWFVRQRPSKVLVRKDFGYRGKLFQINVTNLTDHQIYQRLLSAFEDFKNNSYLARFYFDLQSFVSLGKHVRWCSVLSDNNA